MSMPDNQMLVIFGASGDLTKRKLLPSLLELYIQQQLPEHFVILGTGRTPFTDRKYRAAQKENLKDFCLERGWNPEEADNFLNLVYYLSFDTDNPAAYRTLKERIIQLRQEAEIPDCILFYLSTPPQQYECIAHALRKVGLNHAGGEEGWRRIIVEKPFGSSLETARQLNRQLCSIFQENEIYRIDHYLGKETVQNILILRFANGIFEPLWNRNYIDYVEIKALEEIGIANRGRYYEKAGALRDMIQNHLMQLLGFVAMEAPASFDAELMRDEVAKVFRSLHPLSGADIVRGQYVEGVMNGEPVAGYRNEKDVAPDSYTETYVAMRFFIDNWRWGGVPFYFYTGKRLSKAKAEIIIHFKTTPHHFFAGTCPGSSCNQLVLRIEKDESISLRFGLKVPGAAFEVQQVSMDFSYRSLNDTRLATAYERLLLDAMQGDSTLYTRSDALEMSWRFVDPVLQQWTQEHDKGLYFYPAGSDGPEERKRLLHYALQKDLEDDTEDCVL